MGDQLAAKPESPGRNYAPVLCGETVKWDNMVFYEFENIRAVRTERWKYIERILEPPEGELYDLQNDPGERHSLFNRPEHAVTQKQLRDCLYRFFARYVDPKWDLWKGGKSKSDLMTGKLFKLEGLEKQVP
jgi:arylsulfatase A-like enzyme